MIKPRTAFLKVNQSFMTTDNHEKYIFITSTVIVTILFLFAPITYSPDSNSYMNYAKTLVNLTSQNDFNLIDLSYYRTIGYPLLIAISGVFHLNSFYGLILIQSFMAILIPIFIYRIVLIYDKQVAYYTALFSIFSLFPYAYMKSVLTEQSSIFFLLFTIYFASKYFNTQKIRYIYYMFGFSFILILIRTSFRYIFLIFFATVFIYTWKSQKKNTLHVLLALIIVLTLILGLITFRNKNFSNPEMKIKLTNMTNMTGRLLFFNVYLTEGHSYHYDGVIRSENGPASRKFVNILKNHLHSRNYYSSISFYNYMKDYDYFFGKYENDPAKLFNVIIKSPARLYYWFLWKIIDEELGPSKADNLFLKVSLETLRNKPVIGLKFISTNIFHFVKGFTIHYTYSPLIEHRLEEKKQVNMHLRIYTARPPSDILTEEMSKELKFMLNWKIFNKIKKSILSLWSPLYKYVRPLSFILMLCGLILLLKSKYTPISLLSIMIIFYQMFTVCVFNEARDRYVMQTILVEFLVAGPVLGIFFNKLWKLKRKRKID